MLLASYPETSMRWWELTAGRLTLGIITECSALGASLGAAFGSPPGWYWYFPVVPDCHGAEFGAMLTGCSEEEDVGLRASSGISDSPS
jgi:hypothetical protein